MQAHQHPAYNRPRHQPSQPFAHCINNSGTKHHCTQHTTVPASTLSIQHRWQCASSNTSCPAQRQCWKVVFACQGNLSVLPMSPVQCWLRHVGRKLLWSSLPAHLQHSVDPPKHAESCHGAAGTKGQVDSSCGHQAQAQQQPG
jgi:hypothetical protein